MRGGRRRAAPLERITGFEPATSTLARSVSYTHLVELINYAHEQNYLIRGIVLFEDADYSEEGLLAIRETVSYTHLDVYKRQHLRCLTSLHT